jgi:hypothetical protein
MVAICLRAPRGRRAEFTRAKGVFYDGLFEARRWIFTKLCCLKTWWRTWKPPTFRLVGAPNFGVGWRGQATFDFLRKHPCLAPVELLLLANSNVFRCAAERNSVYWSCFFVRKFQKFSLHGWTRDNHEVFVARLNRIQSIWVAFSLLLANSKNSLRGLNNTQSIILCCMC